MASWIKMELGRVFPEADFKEGIDFDASGEVEPWEEIRDDDGDDIPGSHDDWEYLYRRNEEFARLHGGLLERADALGMDSYSNVMLGYEAYDIPEEDAERAAFFVAKVVQRFRQKQREGVLLTNGEILEMMPTIAQAAGLVKTENDRRYNSESLARGETTDRVLGLLRIAVGGALGIDNLLSEEGAHQYENVLNEIRYTVAFLCFTAGRYRETVNLLDIDMDRTLYASAYTVFVLRAQARMELKDYDGALVDLAHAETLDSAKGNIFLFHGKVYERQGDDAGALEAYLKAKELGIKSYELDTGLGNIYFRQKLFGRAKSAFRDALEKGGGSVDLYYKLGTSLLHAEVVYKGKFVGRKSHFVNARNFLDKAIASDRTKPEYFKARGHVFLKLRMPDEARADFKSALALDPENFQIARELLDDAHTRSDWEGVIRYAEVMFKTDPANALARHYHGQALMVLDKDIEGALEGFNIVLEENPESGIAYASRASVRLRGGDIDGALMDIAQAKKRDVHPVLYAAAEAQCYIKRQQYAQAVEAYKELIRHETWGKKKASNFIQLGNTYVDWGKYRMALKCFKKAHELDPSSEDAPVLYHETMREVEW